MAPLDWSKDISGYVGGEHWITRLFDNDRAGFCRMAPWHWRFSFPYPAGITGDILLIASDSVISSRVTWLCNAWLVFIPPYLGYVPQTLIFPLSLKLLCGIFCVLCAACMKGQSIFVNCSSCASSLGVETRAHMLSRGNLSLCFSLSILADGINVARSFEPIIVGLIQLLRLPQVVYPSDNW